MQIYPLNDSWMPYGSSAGLVTHFETRVASLSARRATWTAGDGVTFFRGGKGRRRGHSGYRSGRRAETDPVRPPQRQRSLSADTLHPSLLARQLRRRRFIITLTWQGSLLMHASLLRNPPPPPSTTSNSISDLLCPPGRMALRLQPAIPPPPHTWLTVSHFIYL